MNTWKVMWSGCRSALRRRPGIVALSGTTLVLLTPFAMFPEIMGDRGVTDAGPLRNGAALVLLTSGLIAAGGGMVILVRQLWDGR